MTPSASTHAFLVFMHFTFKGGYLDFSHTQTHARACVCVCVKFTWKINKAKMALDHSPEFLRLP